MHDVKRRGIQPVIAGPKGIGMELAKYLL